MSKRILVLDDEPWNVSWISDLGKHKGWDTDFAAKFEDAESLFSTHNHEIVVVDIRIGDESPPAKGATLEATNPSWVGLRFVRHIIVEKKSKATVFVYTGLDRADLRKTVEDAFQARFYSKFESSYFENSLEKEIEKRNSSL